MSEATIAVSGLRKRFGTTLALDGMSFSVYPGQVTGFVGPNGAGKPVTGLGHSFTSTGGWPRHQR
jgi:ABC-2 type transport system ATP-binding protein